MHYNTGMTVARPQTSSPFAWLPWLLSASVSGLAVYVWGSSVDWRLGGLSVYQIFPLLGLLAWSIMWSQYVTGLLRRFWLPGSDLRNYYSWTGYFVLFAILMHPGLLAYQRLRDGFGLPPRSETSYVAPSLSWVVVLGMVSLLVFLSFELHRWFQDRRWWRYVGTLVDLAMLAIFYHALRLGTQTHIGWFRWVWWFYGLVLVIVLLEKYLGRLFIRRSPA